MHCPHCNNNILCSLYCIWHIVFITLYLLNWICHIAFVKLYLSKHIYLSHGFCLLVFVILQLTHYIRVEKSGELVEHAPGTPKVFPRNAQSKKAGLEQESCLEQGSILYKATFSVSMAQFINHFPAIPVALFCVNPKLEFVLLCHWWNKCQCLIIDSGIEPSPIFAPGTLQHFFQLCITFASWFFLQYICLIAFVT